MSSLEGKVAIVTGAGRHNGIGRHIALALARQGADVAVTGSGRSPEAYPEDEKEIGWRDIESVAGEIRETGRRALPLVVDITDAAQVQRLVDETRSELGRIDILVNNAAAARGRDRVPVVHLDEAEWRKVLDVNLTGTFLVTKAVANALIEQSEGGRIVNISSVAGRTQGPIRDAAMRTIPLRREGNPEEIGETVAFLCGPNAAYIHGQSINVDGGRAMR
jgi:NAD(P)-dependent dehydrogenase (short-subunit alcohol dehydrogenase family)